MVRRKFTRHIMSTLPALKVRKEPCFACHSLPQPDLAIEPASVLDKPVAADSSTIIANLLHIDLIFRHQASVVPLQSMSRKNPQVDFRGS